MGISKQGDRDDAERQEDHCEVKRESFSILLWIEQERYAKLFSLVLDKLEVKRLEKILNKSTVTKHFATHVPTLARNACSSESEGEALSDLFSAYNNMISTS